MNNTTRGKPKILIIGHARHGKDSFAALVVAKMDLSFVSSSEFVGRECIWEQWGKERYCSFSEFFEDRVNHRGLWFNFIVAYNTPNLARTGEEMMKEHDIYVGMRNPDEFNACMDKKLFDYVIWVDGSQRHPPEGKDSNGMTREMADIWIDNNGPEFALNTAVANLQIRLNEDGFDVNYKPKLEQPATPATEIEPGLYSKEMEKIWHEDDQDISEEDAEREAIIDAEYDREQTTLEAYPGIVNPPMVPNQGAKPPEQHKEKSDTPFRMIPEDEKWKDDKMIVNPTLEESRRFHNDALMATISSVPTVTGLPGPPKIIKDWKPKTSSVVPYTGGERQAVAERPPFVSNKVPQSTLRVGDTAAIEKKSEPFCDRPRTWKDMPDGATLVLDHGFFQVKEVMGSDKTILGSARMSYGRGTKKTSPDDVLMNYLVKNGHTSPLEMGEIRFHIRMPIFVMRQWVRHRTANLNEYSGRYSEMVALWYVPNNAQIRAQGGVNKQGSGDLIPDDHATNIANEIARHSRDAFTTYEGFLKAGLSRETARMVLPLNTYTEVVWKLDISNLIKFLLLRDDSHAQWEIRQYAKLVSDAVEEHFPLVFAAYKKLRNSETFTRQELYALLSGDCSHMTSKSAIARVHDIREEFL